MLNSKFSVLPVFFAVVLTTLALWFLYSTIVVVAYNTAALRESEVLLTTGINVLAILFFVVLLKRFSRSFVIYEDRLEVRNFFGLFKQVYRFDKLKFSYSSLEESALLELPGGRKLSIRRTEYTNFHEMVGILGSDIVNLVSDDQHLCCRRSGVYSFGSLFCCKIPA